MNDAAGTWSRAPAEQPSVGGVPDPAPVTAAGARERMTLPAVPPEHRAPVLETLPAPRWSGGPCRPATAPCSARGAHPRPRLDWPHAPSGAGDLGHYFYPHLCLLALPAASPRRSPTARRSSR
ncbi:hypothetical protein [Streptomyces parvulus]|uniref:hypothetical protein n=1 Tax=Streptomyces parvulus TaxID=146923 RepID=UPI00339FADA4